MWKMCEQCENREYCGRMWKLENVWKYEKQNVRSKIWPIGFKKIIWKNCSLIFVSSNSKLANLFFFFKIFSIFFTFRSWVKDSLKEILKDFVGFGQHIEFSKIFLKLYLVVSSRYDEFRKWFQTVFILILISLVV